MASFVDRVRKSELKHPAQQGFDAEYWRRVSRSGECDDADRNLAEAGLFVFEELEAIRHDLENIFPPPITKLTALRLFTGFENRIFQSVDKQTNEAWQKLPEHRAISDHFLTPLTGDSGDQETDAETILEESVDGATLIFRPILRSDDLPQADTALDRELLKKIEITHSKARLYRMYQQLWMECLWTECRFSKAEGTAIFDAYQTPWAKSFCVFQARRFFLKMEIALRYSNSRREQQDLPDLRSIRTPRRRIRFRQERDVLYAEAINEQPSSDEILKDYVVQLWSQKTYFDGILDKPLPAIRSLTANKLIISRKVLTEVGQAAQAALPRNPEVQNAQDLLAFSPILSRGSIRDLLHGVVPGITREDANQIIEFFTLGKTKETSQDLWFRPIIRIDQDKILIVVAALAHGSLEREIENWFSCGKAPIGLDGGPFEQSFRSEVQAAISGSSLKEKTQLYPSAFRLKMDGGDEEEIDLFMRLGNKLLIGELKCQFYPARPIEWFDHMRRLEEGCTQAARKAKAVMANLEFALQQSGFGNHDAASSWSVVPFVVSNHQLGSGTSYGNVPIIDPTILVSFFNPGGFSLGVQYDLQKREFVEPGQTFRYYQSDAEAIATIEQYLLNPPQVRNLEDCTEAYESEISSSIMPEKPAVIHRIRLNRTKTAALLRNDTH